jgi:hypothetical protein
LVDKDFAQDILSKGQKIYEDTGIEVKKILDLVNQKIGV